MGLDSSIPIRPETHRFLVDLMLGTLVPYLKVCGYDTVYVGDRDIETDAEIAHAATTEHRILLTRDTALTSQTKHAIRIDGQTIEAQLHELQENSVALQPTTTPQRCGACNTHLEPISLPTRLPDYVPSPRPRGLWCCPTCDQYFWKGSHWDTMQHRIATIISK